MASAFVNTTVTQTESSVEVRAESDVRVGFLASHPIQYLSPLLREVARRVDLHVFYAHNPDPEQQAAAGFNVEFEWDTDLLNGYKYTFLKNEAKEPDARVGNFFGCDTPEIYDRISSDRFDAFIVNGWYLKSFWQAVWACRRSGIPVFARGDSQLLTPRSWWKRTVKQVGYRILLQAFDGFLSVGERFDAYLKHYGIPEDRIYRAPHAVDNSWFFDRAQRTEENGAVQSLRDEMGVDSETIVLLFVGKYISVKRADDLLKAVRVLGDRGVDVCAVYVGSGPCEETLVSEAERLNVPARFVGFKNQSELPAYYAMADAIVLPSESETWGLVINEAMACGTPALVSEAVGCRPDLIIEGETGYSYPVGDVEALASVVQKLVKMREGGHDFESSVLNHITNYSTEAAAEGITKTVHSVVWS